MSRKIVFESSAFADFTEWVMGNGQWAMGNGKEFQGFF